MKTLCLGCCLAGVLASASPARAWEDSDGFAAQARFPLGIAILDPEAMEKVPPYIVMFEEGLDDRGNDVTAPVGRLESLRGASKMFPESNKDPGLPVVLRGLRLHESRGEDGELTGYEVELQGEFNMVKVPVAREEVEKFLAGQPARFDLEGKKNFGLYSYTSTVKMELQRVGGEIYILKASGDFTFREGLYRYTSKTKVLTPPAGRKYLYRCELAELPKLPQI